MTFKYFNLIKNKKSIYLEKYNLKIEFLFEYNIITYDKDKK